MADACTNCKNWEELYLCLCNHFDDKMSQFFKPMMGNFSQRLMLPKKFVYRFRENLPMAVDLKGPGGRKTHIGLTKDQGDTFFQSGWTDFVEEHHIEEHDLLVFKYDGKSSFNVTIFDETGCQRESSCFIKNPDPVNRKGKAPIESMEISTSQNDVSESISLSSSEDSHEISSLRSAHNLRSGRTWKGTKQGVQKPKLDLGISYANHLNAGDKRKAVKLAQAIQSGNPFFALVIRSSSVGKTCYLGLPLKFVKAHLPNSSQPMILQTRGRKQKWTVSYCVYEKKSLFIGDWKTFVSDNNLQEGDVCVFELLKGRRGNVNFMVHIAKASS